MNTTNATHPVALGWPINFTDPSFAMLDFHSHCNYTYVYDNGVQLCGKGHRSFRSSWGAYNANDYL